MQVPDLSALSLRDAPPARPPGAPTAMQAGQKVNPPPGYNPYRLSPETMVHSGNWEDAWRGIQPPSQSEPWALLPVDILVEWEQLLRHWTEVYDRLGPAAFGTYPRPRELVDMPPDQMAAEANKMHAAIKYYREQKQKNPKAELAARQFHVRLNPRPFRREPRTVEKPAPSLKRVLSGAAAARRLASRSDDGDAGGPSETAPPAVVAQDSEETVVDEEEVGGGEAGPSGVARDEEDEETAAEESAP